MAANMSPSAAPGSDHPNVGPLEASDVDAAVALWHSCGLTRPWNPPEEDFARALATPTSAVLGVRRSGALVGTVMLGMDGHRGWVYYLAVDAASRGMGYGTLLMRAAEHRLAELGASKVQLMVRHGNPVAGFYAALGYEDQGATVLGRFLDGRARTL